MQLNAEAADILARLSVPIAFGRREEFLRLVAEALAGQRFVNGHRFAKGDRVRITSGAFDGHGGVYDGEAKRRTAYVLVALLGRQIRVKILSDALAAA